MLKDFKDFGKLKTVALSFLKREKFEQNEEGKAYLTQEDKEKLKGAFSEDFIAKFEQGLDVGAALEQQETAAEAAMDQLRSDNQVKLDELQVKVNAAVERATKAEAKVAKIEEEKAALQSTVEVLSASAEEDLPIEVIQGGGSSSKEDKKGPWLGVKLNGKHFHNQMVTEYLAGTTAKLMASSSDSFGVSTQPGASGNTINVDEIASEFGTYLSQKNTSLEIRQILTQKTESQKYMTTKMAVTEWRASTAVITNVVQQYISEWTPSGAAAFHPLTIKNRRHKVNLPIKPDDINDSWLSYLYDEKVSVEQMPITRFIVEKLLRPKIDNNIEMLMIATGRFEELPVDMKENDPGQSPEKAMDGYVTILQDLKTAGDTAAKFFTPSVALTDESVVDVIEEYADWIENEAPLYAKAGMNIFIDPKLHRKFKRKYRELYPTTKNEDAKKDSPDFSNLNFVPLNAMRGTGVFFSTPKENFIRLIHKNAAGAETKLWMQIVNYTVKVFAEFWLGVGFAMKDLIFAYVPEEAASGSGA